MIFDDSYSRERIKLSIIHQVEGKDKALFLASIPHLRSRELSANLLWVSVVRNISYVLYKEKFKEGS